MRTPIRFVVVAAALALAAAPALAQNLTGAGATFPYPLYSKWFDEYRQKTGVAINYQSIGSGAGIQQVRAGTVDFGASDAPLSDDALRDMPRAVVHFPMVAGAVVLAYDLPGLSAPLVLSSDVVTAIYLGKITTWNDRRLAALNPGTVLPAAPILPVHRSDGSGTTYIFTTYLASASTQWKELVGAGTAVSWPVGIGGKGNDGVAGLVRQTPGSVGYVELAYAKQNRLTVAALRNRAGPDHSAVDREHAGGDGRIGREAREGRARADRRQRGARGVADRGAHIPAGAARPGRSREGESARRLHRVGDPRRPGGRRRTPVRAAARGHRARRRGESAPPHGQGTAARGAMTTRSAA